MLILMSDFRALMVHSYQSLSPAVWSEHLLYAHNIVGAQGIYPYNMRDVAKFYWVIDWFEYSDAKKINKFNLFANRE